MLLVPVRKFDADARTTSAPGFKPGRVKAPDESAVADAPASCPLAIETFAPPRPAPVALSVTVPLSENVCGGAAGESPNTKLSTPIGLRQQDAALFVRAIVSVSTVTAFRLVTVRNWPNVLA